MAAVMFDTHVVIKRLQESGFSEQQAEAVTGVLQNAQQLSLENLATKQELREWGMTIQRDMKELTAATQRDIKELETVLRKDMDVKLSELKADLMKWTMGLLLAQIAVVAALVKLL